MTANAARIVLGWGCFWCLEAVFVRMAGVTGVASGYAGGRVPDPTYEAVCAGTTGHAEVVNVSYDPDAVTLEELLAVFFAAHDPTQLDRQGADVGTQYRSAVFAPSSEEIDRVRGYVDSIRGEFANPIVTRVERLDGFWPADISHDRYYELNPGRAYCQFVIAPKLAKVLEKFPDRVSEELRVA